MRCVLEKTHCVVALLRLALRLTIASQSAIAAAATLSEEAIETFIAHCDVAAWDLLLPYGAKVLRSPVAIATNLFGAIKQSVGELRGEDESFAAVRSRFEKYTFENAADAAGFTKDITFLQTESAEKVASHVPGISALMRKDKEPAEVYNYLFGLQYLEPRYTLLFQDTRIEQLSPGQRGALLLIFYLLVDKGRNPIVLDQPEENLDNETVVSL